LRIWDTKTGKALVEHAIRPSGVKIPTNEEDGSASFDRPFDMFSMRLSASTLSPDASRFLITLESTIYVFDVATGRELYVIQNDEPGHMMGLEVSADLQHLASSTMGRSVQTKLPDGRTRVSTERNQIVQIRRLEDGTVRHKLVFPGGAAGPVAFSADSKLLAAATRNTDGPIRVLSVESGETVAEITGLGSEPRGLAFSGDGRMLASSLTNTSVLIWDWRQFEKKQ
jgi:WD40 repeat protein